MATSNVIPLSATQPQAMSALRSPVALNPARSARSGARSQAGSRVRERPAHGGAEVDCGRAPVPGRVRPRRGVQIDKNRSRAYPKLTRVKCVSMLARLMNLLFQASEKNWGVGPSAVPDLSAEDLQAVLDELMPPGSDASQVPSDERIEAAICKFAEKRACAWSSKSRTSSRTSAAAA
jgi:hypothetical protein